MSSKITEKTLIPLSLVITLSGGIYWFTATYFQSVANAKDIAELKSDNRGVTEIMRSVDTRLSRIEGKLGVNQK